MNLSIHQTFLQGALILQQGCAKDYRALERFHYVPKRPATWASVVVARYVPGDGQPIRLIGVGVLSYPSALLRARHRTFGLKPMHYGQRMRWSNAHVRTISRIIVHPQFRGIGLSTLLIHWLRDQCSTRYIEAPARMGHAHPLFERAGFTRVEPIDADEPVYYWFDRLTPSPGMAGRGLG